MDAVSQKKMKDLNVLATAVGGAGAHGIFQSLRKNRERKIRIVGTDMSKDAYGLFLADKSYIVPAGVSNDYIPRMAEIVKKEKIDVIMPFSPKELLPLSENKKVFEELGAKVLISGPDVIRMIQDRYMVLKHLKNLVGFRFKLVKSLDEFEVALNELGYPGKPVCFKPRIEIGGGRGFRIVEEIDPAKEMMDKKSDIHINIEQALNILKDAKPFPELLVMEYLPGPEYSTDLLARKGETLVIVPRKRMKVSLGASSVGITEKNEKVIKKTRSIVKSLPLDYNVNVQLKFSESDEPEYIEINPRVSGTICLCTAAGVNLPYLGVKMVLGENFDVPEPRWGIKMIRHNREMYLDESGHPHPF
jgi:carbamoyl-phosphate synthase large subunit